MSSSTATVGRYAPTPSGGLHLGNVLAALAAAARADTLLLRMEDLDTPRVKARFAAQIVDELAFLGFRFDARSTQSDDLAPYQRALDLLDEGGHLFGCRCSRKELAEQQQGESGPRYPGTCRDKGLPIDDPSLAVRFQPREGTVLIDDGVFGPFTQDVAREVGAFVVRRKDGIFAYHLAVVVDDAREGVTEVVRGVDLLEASARQTLLFEALGHRAPGFAHAPLLVDERGRRLAKRDGDHTITAMRERGISAPEILGWLGEALEVTEGPVALDALLPRIDARSLKKRTVSLPARARSAYGPPA